MTTITEGSQTFARLSYTGTQRGAVFGIVPTGKRFEYGGAALFTFSDDLISEVWVLGDIHGLMSQLSDDTGADGLADDGPATQAA